MKKIKATYYRAEPGDAEPGDDDHFEPTDMVVKGHVPFDKIIFKTSTTEHGYFITKSQWEGIMMIIDGVDYFIPSNRGDKKGNDQAKFLNDAISLLKKGIGQ